MRIAIVGSGVSGLVAAHALHPAHEITVFEADQRVGGHVHTWTIETPAGPVAVDSGFIVFNETNYPHFTKLIRSLGVASQPTDMSFSVRNDRTGLEYNPHSARTLFAQPTNALRPAFWRMLGDVVRFNRESVLALRAGLGNVTLGELLEQGHYHQQFRENYLQPLGSALWSVPRTEVLDMPAEFFIRFFENHGMLSVRTQPKWRVIVGGSNQYVRALIRPFEHRIRLGTPVRTVSRVAGAVLVNGESFDRVVFACHSDQALRLLADPTPDEQAVLGALPYQENTIVLHTDTAVLPRRRAAWGAWNYHVTPEAGARASLTYNMNILQSLRTTETYCVTLNGTESIAPSRVLGRVVYHHPRYTLAGFAAQARRSEISGVGGTHFCGAYWGNGFHEDGVASALAVVNEIGCGQRTT
ncbi:MAG: FAD-dependent oxidoreductase [Gemmatimonadetes bacterium]|nr:FAD-dependent oxidoreductase [Gemmatimonadota bacterium]